MFLLSPVKDLKGFNVSSPRVSLSLSVKLQGDVLFKIFIFKEIKGEKRFFNPVLSLDYNQTFIVESCELVEGKQVLIC